MKAVLEQSAQSAAPDGDAKLLSAENLRLGYDRTDAVKGVTFDVDQGQIVALLGANGAGKTTILRSLSGLLKPRAGKIFFDGQDITFAPAHRIAKLGLVQSPEGRQVFAQMSVDENLAMGAYLERDSHAKKQRREAALARFPRLRERLSQPAGLLSGGEQQMLAMARALMADPKLLLLDEPSMGLAPLFVEEIFRIVAELKAEGCTILLVEQNASAALELADYAYVLESGAVSLQGPARAIAENPDIAAAYLGA